MGIRKSLSFILILATSTFLAGCSAISPFGGPRESVTFTVRIEPEFFSPEATLHVRIWDSEQLKIAESVGNCAVTYNAETETEEVHCPEGVEYQEPFPEVYAFPVQDIGEEFDILSTTVTVDEEYRLQISGLSSDNCNTASASVQERARAAQIILEDLMWATTMMACP